MIELHYLDLFIKSSRNCKQAAVSDIWQGLIYYFLKQSSLCEQETDDTLRYTCLLISRVFLSTFLPFEVVLSSPSLYDVVYYLFHRTQTSWNH